MAVYRLLLSPFFHAGVLHLVMNMLAFQGLGTSLERSLGTFEFVHLVFLFSLVSNVVADVISWVLFVTDAYPAAFRECSIGFSGVLFAMIVLRSHSTNAPLRSNIY